MRNEVTDHIPIGYYHDLFDTVNDNIDACDEGGQQLCGAINDEVSGFTHEQMFIELNSFISSPSAFKDNLNEGLPPNIQAEVTELFISY